jgi:predicted dehydrogenase
MSSLRVGIVGCGRIADQHVSAIARIPSSALVAVCDAEPLMAEQLADRFKVPAMFTDVAEMIRAASVDVVHITTPPQSHFALARLCLDMGCHVYLEKPFTVTAPDAIALLDLAQRTGRKITAGHNYQFSKEMMELRRQVASGVLGGAPHHIESHWSYDLGDKGYIGPILARPDHWVRRMPGQLFHNLISHGLAKVAEFLGDDVEVMCSAHQSPRLQRLGGAEVCDELRVLIRDRAGVTAFFCFSTGFKPPVNQLRVFGAAGTMTADILAGTVVAATYGSYKSYLNFVVPALKTGTAFLKNAGRNVLGIATQRLHQDFGLYELVARFHECVRTDGPVPIPYREIALTARIMDEVFAALPRRAPAETPPVPAPVS